MNKIILFVLSVIMCVSSYGFSESYLSDFFDVNQDLCLENDDLLIDEGVQKKYMSIARQFTAQGSTTTNVVTFQTLNNGVNAHVGWYVDGYIATALDGAEAGKQIIVLNNLIIGISYNMKVYQGHFMHEYPRAKVTSYPNRQSVIFK